MYCGLRMWKVLFCPSPMLSCSESGHDRDCVLWGFPAISGNPGTAEATQLLIYWTSDKSSIANAVHEKKKILWQQFWPYLLLTWCHHTTADVSCLFEETEKLCWESPTILLAKLVGKLPTKKKRFETSCFRYEKGLFGWVFRRGKRGTKWVLLWPVWACSLVTRAVAWDASVCGLLLFGKDSVYHSCSQSGNQSIGLDSRGINPLWSCFSGLC